MRALLPDWITLVYIQGIILELESLQVGRLIGAICVKVEISIALEGGHLPAAVEVATFLA